MIWYYKLTKKEHNKLRRDNYKRLRDNNVSVGIAVRVRNWRKYYVKQFIKNGIHN